MCVAFERSVLKKNLHDERQLLARNGPHAVTKECQVETVGTFKRFLITRSKSWKAPEDRSPSSLISFRGCLFIHKNPRCRQQTEKYPIKLSVLLISRTSKRIIFFGFQVGHFYLLRFNHYLCCS